MEIFNQKIYNKRKILILLSICAFNLCIGQDKFGMNIIPPSPEATAIHKYEEIPVSYYTGVPNISIPLGSIKDGHLGVNFGLNYHAGGFKVSEEAPRTGLGWTMSGEGLISRSIVGLPDDQIGKGFFRTNDLYNVEDLLIENLDSYEEKTALYEAVYVDALNGCIDTEPDVFYVALPDGTSFSFYFNWDEKIIQNSNRKIKIERYDDEDSYIQGFKITDELGVKYYFGPIISLTDYDNNSTETTRPAYNHTGSIPGCLHSLLNNINPPITTWRIVKIESTDPDGSCINYHYEPYDQYQKVITGESHQYRRAGHSFQDLFPTHYNKGITYFLHRGSRLVKVTNCSGDLEIKFIEGNVRRQDLKTVFNSVNPARYPLERMEFISSEPGKPTRIYKTFNFSYDYRTNRLTLNKLQEEREGEEIYPEYEFFYSTNRLPDTDSYAQDYWGFKNNNSRGTLLTKMYWDNFIEDVNNYGALANLHLFFSERDAALQHMVIPMSSDYNADRNPSSTGSLAGLISGILWPTGRFTEFEFETHDYYFNNNGEELTEWIEGEIFSHDLRSEFTSETGAQNYEVTFTTPDFTELSEEKLIVELSNSGSFRLGQANVSLYNGDELIENTTIGGFGYNRDEIRLILSPNETYTLKATVWRTIDGATNLVAAVQYREPGREVPASSVGIKGRIQPGARISRLIEHYDDHPNNSFVRRFDYTKEDETRGIISTGIGSNLGSNSGMYGYVKIVSASSTNIPSPYPAFIPTAPEPLFTLTAVNRSLLGTTKGSTTGYSQVTEYIGEHGAGGKNIHYFTTSVDFNDRLGSYFLKPPFKRIESQDIFKGRPTRTEYYNYKDEKVREITFTYEDTDFGDDILNMGLSLGSSISFDLGYFPTEESDFDYFMSLINRVHYHPITMDFYRMVKKTVKTFYEEQDPTIEATIYKYDEEIKALRQEKKNLSNGDSLMLYYAYNIDAEESDSENIERNILLLPYEQNTFLIEGDSPETNKFVSGVRTNYDNDVVPKSKSEILTSPGFPVPTSKLFEFTDQNISYIPRLINMEYNENHSLIAFKEANGFHKRYIYGYEDNKFPVAEIIGDKNSASYYEGFETLKGVSNEIQNARTGEYGWLGTLVTPITGEGTYKVSYWVKTEVGDWILEEKFIQNSSGDHIIINETRVIDDVRIVPSNEPIYMNTYTYDEVNGLTSITDSNYYITYFEYDDLGRLSVIKDDEGNIVESFDYSYKQLFSE